MSRAFEPGTKLGSSVYRCVKELGSGQFGTAFLCTDDKGNRVVVKRFLKFDGDNLNADSLHELQAVSSVAARISHANVCQFIEQIVDPGDTKFSSGLATVFEYCAAGSLEDFILERRKLARPLTQHELLCCADQLAAGLGALHEAGIIHRDIAARNIFLSDLQRQGDAKQSPRLIELKIGDFGQAKYIGSHKTSTPIGIGVDVAPETELAPIVPYDMRADVFSLGIVLVELMTLSRVSSATASVLLTDEKNETKNRYSSIVPFVIALLESNPVHRKSLWSFRADVQLQLQNPEIKETPSITGQQFAYAPIDEDAETSKRLMVFKQTEMERFFSRKLGNAFVPRDWLLGAVAAWTLPSSSRRVILIKGDPGIGKSTLVASIISAGFPGYAGERTAGAQSRFSVLAFHACMVENPDSLSVSRFVRNVASMLCLTVPGYAAWLRSSADGRAMLDESECNRNPHAVFQSAVLLQLGKIHPQGLNARGHQVHLVVVDSLDESRLSDERWTIAQLLSDPRVLELVPSWLRIVATTRQEARVLELFQAREPALIEINAHDEHNLDNINQYVQRRLAGNARSQLRSGDLQPSSIALAADGNFLVAKTLLDALDAGHTVELKTNVPLSLDDAYAMDFRLRFSDYASSNAQSIWRKAKTAFEIIAAARRVEPLDSETLNRALQLAYPDLDISDRALFPDLSAFLVVKSEFKSSRRPGSDLVSVHHESLLDWLTQTNTLFKINVARGHAILARLCSSREAEALMCCAHVELSAFSSQQASDLFGGCAWADWKRFGARSEIRPGCISLEHAIAQRYWKYCSYLLASGHPVDGIAHDGGPMLGACSTGHEPLVRALLDGKATVSLSLAIDQAFLKGPRTGAVNLSLARVLLSDYALSPSEHALRATVAEDNVDVVLLCQESKLVISQWPLLHKCVSAKMVQLLVKSGCDLEARDAEGRTPFLACCLDSNLSAACELLRLGANPRAVDANGCGAVHLAQSSTVLQYLVSEAKLDVEARDCRGRTALFDSVLVEELLSLGANPNVQDIESWTPFLHSVFSGSLATAQLLVDYRADPGVTTAAGCNALHLAASRVWHSASELLWLLEDCYLDENASDFFGRTPLHYARSPASAEFLIAHGADVTALDLQHNLAPIVAANEELCRRAADQWWRLFAQGTASDEFAQDTASDATLVAKAVALDKCGVLHSRDEPMLVLAARSDRVELVRGLLGLKQRHSTAELQAALHVQK